MEQDVSLLEQITTAAIIALAVGAPFVLLARGWLAVANAAYRPPFPNRIFYEPGHRFRRNLRVLQSHYQLYLAGLLVFLVAFAVAYLLPLPVVGGPSWVWVVLTFVLIGVLAAYLVWLVKLRTARTQLAYARDANIAVGHALQQLVERGSRVFYNVADGDSTIDNVVAGPSGVYAVNVVVRGKRVNGRANGTVRFDGKRLDFAGVAESTCVRDANNKVTRLANTLSTLVGHKVHVRSVIAVPGWEVNSPGTDNHLVVNEKNVVMLSGWRDREAFLMEEDVTKIYEHLTDKCRNRKWIPA